MAVSFFVSVAESEQNILAEELMGTFDSAFAIRRFLAVTLVTLVSNFIIQYSKLLAVILFVIFALVLADVLRAPPCFHATANYMHAAVGAIMAWASLLLLIKMFTSGPMAAADIYPSLYAEAPPAPVVTFPPPIARGQPLPPPSPSAAAAATAGARGNATLALLSSAASSSPPQPLDFAPTREDNSRVLTNVRAAAPLPLLGANPNPAPLLSEN